MSDIEVAKLMNSQSDFINDLRLTKEVNFLWTNYGGYSWSRTSSEFNVTMTFTIRNRLIKYESVVKTIMLLSHLNRNLQVEFSQLKQ